MNPSIQQRKQRQAQSLKANLLKRKQQQNARRCEDEQDSPSTLSLQPAPSDAENETASS